MTRHNMFSRNPMILLVGLLPLSSMVLVSGIIPVFACYCPKGGWDDQCSVGVVMVEDGVDSGNWQMVATATTTQPNMTLTSVTFRWYGPFGESETPSADPTKLAGEHTDLLGPDFTCVYPAQIAGLGRTYLIPEELGKWYVCAHFVGDYSPKKWTQTDCEAYAFATFDLAIATPWFTSLPLTILTALGFVAVKKRRAQ